MYRPKSPSLSGFSARTAIAIFCCAFIARLPAEVSTDYAWSLSDQFFFNEAWEAFNSPGCHGPIRQREFGTAITLLHVQPRLEKNIRTSMSILEKLRQDTTDEIGVLSQYYLGCIYQLYLDESDRTRALEAFRATLALHSGIPLAEAAASSIVLIEMYDGPDPREPAQKLHQLESLGQELRSPAGQREFHLSMGYAYLDFTDPSNKESLREAVRHFIAAEKIGIARAQDEATVWLAIGEASRLAGDDKTALDYYNRFLAKHKQDRRIELIQRRVHEIRPKCSQ